ncbi:MAG TPA: MauE/DoxX family redox-associated membrane protein [Verrucomicrobiae bacterium]|nr:MauE/DoxX family redox-associated membrane protein [Verrucomicrobiae bacterium]
MSSTALANPVSPGTAPRPWLDYAGMLSRWILGAVFIYMGWTKAAHPEAFLKLLRQYELSTNWFLLNSIAALLPWFEVFCGLLLLAGVAVRGTALLLLAMLIPFTAVVLHRALGIASLQQIAFCAVRFDCGCGNGEVLICRKLVENTVLILLSCGLLTGLGRPLAVWFGLSKAAKL